MISAQTYTHLLFIYYQRWSFAHVAAYNYLCFHAAIQYLLYTPYCATLCTVIIYYLFILFPFVYFWGNWVCAYAISLHFMQNM